MGDFVRLAREYFYVGEESVEVRGFVMVVGAIELGWKRRFLILVLCFFYIFIIVFDFGVDGVVRGRFLFLIGGLRNNVFFRFFFRSGGEGILVCWDFFRFL